MSSPPTIPTSQEQSPSSPSSKVLTSEDRTLITLLEQIYLIEGHLPSVEEAVRRRLTTQDHYVSCLTNEKFCGMLRGRGVSDALLDPKNPASMLRAQGFLTPEQFTAANIMLDLRDNRSQRKKLTELGIPTQKWEAWLRDPIFNNYLRQRAESILPDNLHEAHLALLDRVRSGDTTAIKFYYEITGRYVPLKGTEVDVLLVLTRVVEIIQRFVSDPQTLKNIAEGLAELSQQSLGTTFQGPNTIRQQPEVLPVAVSSGSSLVQTALVTSVGVSEAPPDPIYTPPPSTDPDTVAMYKELDSLREQYRRDRNG